MNADKFKEAHDIASNIPRPMTADDKSPWIVIQYVPTMGTGASAATVTVATDAETMTFLVTAASASGNDAIGGDSSMISLVGSIDTMGELVDEINGARAWRAYLVGALRSDVPSHLLNFSASSCIGENGLTCYSDTSDSLELSLAISGEKFVNNGISGHKTDWDDKCLNSLLYGAFTIGDGTGATTLTYYSGKAGDTEVAMLSITLTEDTLREDGEENATQPYIQAPIGHRLIIRAVTDSTFDAEAINTIGKTAVLSGRRIVAEANYLVG